MEEEKLEVAIDEPDCSSIAMEDANEPSIDDGPDLYFFESDHLALKGNPDYHQLIKCFSILQAQKMKSIEDIETLLDKQSMALKSPIEFVEKLQKKEDMGFPNQQKIAEIPDVNWDRYTSNINLHLFADHKTKPRTKASEFESSLIPKNEENLLSLSENVLVRGRIMKGNKSDTFNRLWTAEEQKTLEDLLIKHPPEAVENRRWQKIANKLGNRTTTQVASRVQKYFIKLAQAGLPIPGRMPTTNQNGRRNNQTRHQRFSKYRFNPSTFFASYEPPVFMQEDDSFGINATYSQARHSPSMINDDNGFQVSDDNLPSELKNTPEYRELMELKEMKSRIIDREGAHYGFKCDKCEMEPIIGVRWHCSDCPVENSVDFCSQCSSSDNLNDFHDETHRLEAIKSSSSHLDSDYQTFSSNSSNYLDPNYVAPQ